MQISFLFIRHAAVRLCGRLYVFRKCPRSHRGESNRAFGPTRACARMCAGLTASAGKNSERIDHPFRITYFLSHKCASPQHTHRNQAAHTGSLILFFSSTTRHQAAEVITSVYTGRDLDTEKRTWPPGERTPGAPLERDSRRMPEFTEKVQRVTAGTDTKRRTAGRPPVMRFSLKSCEKQNTRKSCKSVLPAHFAHFFFKPSTKTFFIKGVFFPILSVYFISCIIIKIFVDMWTVNTKSIDISAFQCAHFSKSKWAGASKVDSTCRNP